ncbi:MAG TPA: ribosomal protein S18-alanine N-acetyltransferase [Longimicrobiales bacterium]|nr:ribosomal protein S18-alanine N-acetyltransferase [Longimicrobiales bacterium]
MSSMAHEAAARADVRLRDMVATDVPAVVAIERASYTMPWSEATFRGLLRRRDAEMVSAETEGIVIGYAAFWCVVDQGELGNVAVSAGWRGLGLGARLVEDVLRRAARRGVREVFLEVRPSNTVARQLYERLGFRPVGRRRNYYQAPVEDAIVLRHLIEPL